MYDIISKILKDRGIGLSSMTETPGQLNGAASATQQVPQTDNPTGNPQANPVGDSTQSQQLFTPTNKRSPSDLYGGYQDYRKSRGNNEGGQAGAGSPIKKREKPEGLSDEDYQYLQRMGFSAETISKSYEPYEPSEEGGYLSRIYELSKQKPEAPDGKKETTNRILASAGDSFQLLGELFAATQGAHIRRRDPGDSALKQILDKEERMRNKYMEQLERYDEGLYSAQQKDFMHDWNDYNNTRKGLYDMLGTKDKLDRAKEQFETTRADKKAKEQRDQDNKDREFGLREKESAARIERIGNLISNGESKDKPKLRSIYVPANESDPDAVEDKFGKMVAVYEFTDDELKNIVSQAKSDKDFIARHPELIIQRPKYEGTQMEEGAYKYADDLSFARTYVKEMYDNQWQPPAAQPEMSPYFGERFVDRWAPNQNWDWLK